jgi:asparagine synthase (glutamine-hydrolysing)
MCGLAGYVGTNILDPKRIERCLGLMRHRGPDASGSFEHVTDGGRRVYLLHTRLSIIDLDPRANQPFRIGPQVLVYNGELYNYVELRRGLEADRCGFVTDSDTEVLLRQLITHGPQGLDRCEGMWALALYDVRDGSLLLARDRFGEKPLYVYEADDGLYFGSEIKLIRALVRGRLGVNYDHLYRYLVNGYKALYKDGAGFFEGVRELRPGTVLSIKGRNPPVETRYWSPSFEPDEGLGYDDVLSEVRDALIRSVRLRLRADVPLAFLMSGGVDSNALISIARNVLAHDVHGFTILSRDGRYDEREVVAHAVRGLGIRHTAIPVDTTGFLERLRSLVAQHDAPVYTISYYAHWLLIQSIAGHGYRISISGTGADELFSGYYDHHNAYLFEVRRDAELFARSLAAWREHVRPMVRNPYLADPEIFVKSRDFRDHIFLDAEAFAGCLARPWREPFSESRYCEGLLRNRMLNELFHEAVPPILHEDDHNAMSASIENRSPFLDRPLFELCQRIPTRFLIRDGFAKVVLRDAMRGIVPDRVLDERRKIGFNAPLGEFLDFGDPETQSALLDESPIFEHVRRDRIERLLADADLPNSRSKFLFYFTSAKLFLEEFAS